MSESRSAPLRLPLETYICRTYLRMGTCPYGPAPTSSSPHAHPATPFDWERMSTISTPSSTSSASSTASDEGTANRFAPSIETGRHRECKFLHVSADDIKPLLRRLVLEGRGFVVCCKDYQCKPNGCRRGIGKSSNPLLSTSGPMCKFLHLSNAEEAEWLSLTSSVNKRMREAYLAGLHVRDADEEVTGANTAQLIAPRVVQADPGQPRIVVGGTTSLQVCRQFIRDQCFRGSECRFRHVRQEPRDSPLSHSSQQQRYASVTSALPPQDASSPSSMDKERATIADLLSILREPQSGA
jgi:hypothetical protein